MFSGKRKSETSMSRREPLQRLASGLHVIGMKKGTRIKKKKLICKGFYVWLFVTCRNEKSFAFIIFSTVMEWKTVVRTTFSLLMINKFHSFCLFPWDCWVLILFSSSGRCKLDHWRTEAVRIHWLSLICKC